jgi:spermidine synthase
MLSPPSTARAERALFALAICASAFLIFLIQPMVAKRVLPWYGGAPAVWTLCLAFYQSTLFLGYAYAHLLIRCVPAGAQLGVHALAIGSALLLLPVLPAESWQPDAFTSPRLGILALLAANVALPFFVLASSGPLLQAWFARRHPAGSPYPLYAVSNVGSLAALLAYPFALEPRLPLSRTGDLWSLGFVAAAIAMLGCAALARRSPFPPSGARPDGPEPARPGRLHTALWFGLSGCAVALLMGVTNELCIDVASVPFLWILPLATYLVTFVLCFGWEGAYRRAPWAVLAGLAFLASTGRAIWLPGLPQSSRVLVNAPPFQIASFCLLLFAVCMLLHGELYRLRPPARWLTAFYLCVSGGGAVGGIFVGIAAPMIFSDYYELEAGLALAGLLFVAAWANDPDARLHAVAPRWRWAAAGAIAVLVLGPAGWTLARPEGALLHRERSFFGVYRVLDASVGEDEQRRLKSGTTLHGVQVLGPWRRLPTSYYGRATGLGLVMAPRQSQRGTRIGVIGLGVGTLAAYGRAGELMRFYEIDPVVVRIARDDGHSSFLEDSPAEIEIVVGDGRLSLTHEQALGEGDAFDYLVIDAFNSDAIPVHLLTVEAFEHYERALAPGGLLAVHASNRHFGLVSLVTRVGLESGLHSLEIVTNVAPRHQSRPSQWVWLGRDPVRIRELERQVRRTSKSLGVQAMIRLGSRESTMNVPVWTDDHSDLFGALRRR